MLGRGAYFAGTIDTRTRITYWTTKRRKTLISRTEFIEHVFNGVMRKWKRMRLAALLIK